MRRSSRAAEAWELLFDLLMRQRTRLPQVAAEFALSEPQCHVLRAIEPGAQVPMRRLVERLGCDASNVTGIVDRLEARGLVERTACPHDRRVRMVRLTPRGTGTRARIVARMSEPPEPIAGLPADDLAALCAILRRALTASRS
jgi:MarR family transcriptional regulator, organic hydroperoxide resistance regulator